MATRTSASVIAGVLLMGLLTGCGGGSAPQEPRDDEVVEGQPDDPIQSDDCLLGDWPLLRLAEAEAVRFLSGLRRRVNEPDREAVRVYGPEPAAFLGSAHITAGELIADRLLSPIEVQALIQVTESTT